MILEGLVTTVDESGAMHLAPMGPVVTDSLLLLKPFATSQTAKNLIRTREGVFHVTDDVLLIAQSVLGQSVAPPTIPAATGTGFVLTGSVRAYEFQVIDEPTEAERYSLRAKVTRVHRFNDWFGFNRAKHAVLEAAILASRFHLLPAEEIDREFDRLRIIVGKTAGPEEERAFAILDRARGQR